MLVYEKPSNDFLSVLLYEHMGKRVKLCYEGMEWNAGM